MMEMNPPVGINTLEKSPLPLPSSHLFTVLLETHCETRCEKSLLAVSCCHAVSEVAT